MWTTLLSLLIVISCVRVAWMRCVVRNTDSRYGWIKMADCSNTGLRKVPQNLPSTIYILNISGNNILDLNNDSFIHYTLLREIILKNNMIQNISQFAFSSLKYLEILDMSNNNLDLSSGIYTATLFESLKHLIDLNLRRNMRQNVVLEPFKYPDDAISNLNNLTAFAVDMVKEPLFGIGFQKLKNLKILTFELCYLEYLKNDSFKNFPSSLEKISLLGCKVHFVHVENGALLPFPKLSVIDFTGTCMHLKQAISLLFPYRGKSMNILNLGGLNCPLFNSENFPYVFTVTSHMMTNLKEICVSTLDVSDNGIIDFGVNSLLGFDKPECIEHLIFRGNRFTFSYGIQLNELKAFFSRAVRLKTYDYSYIPIKFKLPVNDLTYNTPLENIKDTEYVIFPRSIEKITFSHVLAYDAFRLYVILRGSNLSHLDVSFSAGKDGVILPENSNLKIRTLNISGRNFEYFLRNFQHISANYIKTLVMSGSRLKFINYDQRLKELAKLFNTATSTEYLDISDNVLSTLSTNIFKSMQNLSELYMGKNLFQSVPPTVLTFKQLKILDMTNNHLTTLDSDVRNWADELNTKHGLRLFLMKNAFECTCSHVDFIRWVYSTKVSLDSRVYKCKLPNGTLSDVATAYRSMHELYSDCDDTVWLAVAITLVLTTLLVLLIYTQRWKACLFFYSIVRNMIEQKLKSYFTYDVYMSYDSNSLRWIKDVIIPKLQDEWKLKLCLKDRDFLAGESYLHTQAESIEKSRHIIFIVSPSLTNSNELEFELNRVQYEKVNNNTESIIVITKDVSVSDIPVDFYYIWNYVSLLQWPNDNRHLDVFWEKLKKTINNDKVNPLYLKQN